MTPTKPVVTMGEILTAFLAENDVPLGAAARFDRTFAGAESNVAIALARQGVASAFIGRVSTDAFGSAALRHLRGEGVDVASVVADPANSGFLVRSVGSARPTEVVYGRLGSAGSRLAPADIPLSLIAGAAALHFTGITPMLSQSAHQACLLAARIARDNAVPFSFDPNLRFRLAPLEAWRESLAPFLELANIVLIGADEARHLSALDEIEAAARWIRREQTDIIVIKDGAAGSSAWYQDEWHSVPAHSVTSVDPVGAGDAFNAGFLSAWLAGEGIKSAMARGSMIGAAVVTARGDTTGIPATGETDIFTFDVIR